MWVRGVLMTVTDGVGQKWRFISPQYEAAAIAAMAQPLLRNPSHCC